MEDLSIQKPITPALSTTQPQCTQCGNIHPPIPSGQRCPLMTDVETADGKKADLSTFLAMFKTVLESQIPQRGIKDVETFLKKLIINLTQFCEGYKE